MKSKLKINRRQFLGAASSAAVAMPAASYRRVPGANDRINIGLLGCGARSAGHRRMAKMVEKEGNIRISDVCDIWTVNRNRAAEDVKQKFGYEPRRFKYSEEMLAQNDLDAVMIATGDHQHAKLLVEVVKAGKDCYCEKPMANTLEDAKAARDAVLASDRVVQMGSQWVSCPYHRKVRDIVRSGKLGQITRLEQSWNYNGPRWHDPKDPDIAMIREQDTDWKRWLLGRPWRPFDPRVYFEFRIFKDFSGGITDQWMSHGVGLCQFFLDLGIPDDMVANGGIFAWNDVRENPDTFQAVATFQKQGILYSFSTMFGNSHGDHTSIHGKKGTLYAVGGEGSPQWWFKAEMPSRWHNNRPGDQTLPETLAPQLVTIPGHPEIPPTRQSDDSYPHMMNWVECMRTRKKTHGHIMTGFNHSVAIIMATIAYREGKKVYWDPKKEEIVDRPPA